MDRGKPFAKDRCRDADRQTASGRPISAHTIGSLQGGGRKKEVESPNLGLVSLLAGKLLRLIFLRATPMHFGDSWVIIDALKVTQDKTEGSLKAGAETPAIHAPAFLPLVLEAITNYSCHFLLSSLHWTQSSSTIVSYCDSHHNPST